MTEEIHVIGLGIEQAIALLRREPLFLDGPGGEHLLIVCDIEKEALVELLQSKFGDGDVAFRDGEAVFSKRKLDG